MQSRKKDTDRLRDIQAAYGNRYVLVGRPNRPFAPPTDIIQMADKLLIIIEIAGVRPSELSITLLQDSITIGGTRDRPHHNNPAYHQLEINYGEFRVEIPLPWTVERDEVNAAYEAGFLQIELPRKAAHPIRVVEVHNAAEQDNDNA
jgi:HSP20 family protein